jgi:hypothetical protein
MASFHFHEKSGKKGSAKNHSDYISRRGRYARRGDDLIAQGHGNLPAWADSPRTLWQSADAHERANGAAFREIVVALPTELGEEQQLGLLHEFIAQDIGSRPYQYAVHCPNAKIGEGAQPHAHVMYCDRVDDGIERPAELYFRRANAAKPELGGCRKQSGGRHPREMGDELRRRRQLWAETQNSHLSANGHAVKVSHLSLQAQGLGNRAERHLGSFRIQQLDAASRVAMRSERTASRARTSSEKQTH